MSEINISNFNTSNVQKMDGMFSYSKNFTHLDLNNFDTSKVTIFDKMFEGCQGIKELNLTKFNFFNGQSFFDIFDFCENMTVFLSNSARTITKFVEEIPEYVNVKYIP